MMARKPAFLQWLALVVAMGIAAFYAGHFGVLSRIWRDDLSHASSLVAALVVGTTAYIGLLCWRVPDELPTDTMAREEVDYWFDTITEIEDANEWSGVAADLSPAIGLAGTIWGLAQQAAALREGGDVLALLGTALFSTLSGICGFSAILILSHVLQSSLRGARRNG